MSEEVNFDTNEDIIYQIEMMSYMKYNDMIATANDHIGDIYSYRDIEDMKSAEEHYEKELAYQAITQLQQENKQLKVNWNKLKEYLKYEIEFDKRWYIPVCEEYKEQKHFPDDTIDGFQYTLDKMQELEKGSDK